MSAATLTFVAALLQVKATPDGSFRSLVGPLQLRWDNIEGAPDYVDGPDLQWNLLSFRHECALAAGEAATVRVRRRQHWLRIQRVDGKSLASGDLTVRVSNGTGLWRTVTALASDDQKAWFVGNEDLAAQLVEVRNSTSSRVRLAFFGSRLDSETSHSFYRELIPLGGDPVDILEPGRWYADPFWTISPSPTTLTLVGPARFVLFTRLTYDASGLRRSEGYSLRLQVSGEERLFLHQTTVDTAPLSIDGEDRVAGALRAAYFVLPSGGHTVEIGASAPVYARLLRLADDHTLLHPSVRRGLWEHTPSGAIKQTAAVDPGLTLEARRRRRDAGLLELYPGFDAFEHTLQALYDNSNPERLASILAARRLAHRIDTDSFTREDAAAEFRRHLEYLNLSATSRHAVLHRSVDLVATRKLSTNLDQRLRTRRRKEHVQTALEALAEVEMFAVPCSEQEALEFAVPLAGRATRIRCFVALNPDVENARIAIDTHGVVRELVLRSGNLLPSAEFRLHTADTEASLRADGGTDVGLDLLSRNPGARQRVLPRVASAEFALEAGVRQIKIWRIDEDCFALRTSHARPLAMAVQVARAAPYRLTEEEFLAAVSSSQMDIPHENVFLSLFRQWQTGGRPALLSRRVLTTHWESLFAQLRRASQIYGMGVPTLMRRRSVVIDVDHDSELALVDAARRFEREGVWVAALETWRTIVERGTTKTERAAEIGTARALMNLGEPVLAEQHLRRLAFHSDDVQLERYAVAELRRIESEKSGTRRVLLEAALLVERREDSLAPLARALTDAGKFRSALDVWLCAEPSDRSTPEILRCALRSRSWSTFESLLAELASDEEISYWRARRALLEGEPRRALALLARAGDQGEALAGRVCVALGLRARLQSDDLLERVKALFDWESWLERDRGKVSGAARTARSSIMHSLSG